MSGEAHSFLIRTATPACTRFKRQVSHWSSTRFARELVLEIFMSAASTEPAAGAGFSANAANVLRGNGSGGDFGGEEGLAWVRMFLLRSKAIWKKMKATTNAFAPNTISLVQLKR